MLLYLYLKNENLQPVCPVRNKCYWRVPGIGRPLINDFPSSPPYTTPTICFLRHETSEQKMMEGKKQLLTKKVHLDDSILSYIRKFQVSNWPHRTFIRGK